MKDLNNTKNSRGPKIPQWRQSLYVSSASSTDATLAHKTTPKPRKSKKHQLKHERPISSADMLLFIAFLSQFQKAASGSVSKMTAKQKKK